MDLLKEIRNVPDWPKPGIQFKDVTTLAKNPAAFKESCDLIIKKYKKKILMKLLQLRLEVMFGVEF